MLHFDTIPLKLNICLQRCNKCINSQNSTKQKTWDSFFATISISNICDIRLIPLVLTISSIIFKNYWVQLKLSSLCHRRVACNPRGTPVSFVLLCCQRIDLPCQSFLLANQRSGLRGLLTPSFAQNLISAFCSLS